MKNPFEKLERKYEKMKAQRDKARAELLKLRTIDVTIEPSAEYEIKDFEVGKWYKSNYGITARFEGKKNGMGYYSLIWGNWYMADFKHWQEMRPKEIEEVLTNRCKELGLFGGEFDCLTNVWRSPSKDVRTRYRKNFDQLWINNKLAYGKGKFAKLAQ